MATQTPPSGRPRTVGEHIAQKGLTASATPSIPTGQPKPVSAHLAKNNLIAGSTPAIPSGAPKPISYHVGKVNEPETFRSGDPNRASVTDAPQEPQEPQESQESQSQDAPQRYSEADYTGEEAQPTGDDEIIDELKERLRCCIEVEGETRDDAVDDLEFITGERQWDELTKRQREADGRPCMTVNKLPTFLHIVQNNLRHNVPSIHVAPVDSDADPKTAEVMQGLIRHIEYDSNSDIAYDTASTSAAQIGFGYFRLVTEYESDDSFDQKLMFRRIRNALQVYFDPESVEGDGSDARFVILSGRLSKKTFHINFPKATCSYESFDVGAGDGTDRDIWMGESMVRVAEYYRVVETPDVLVELENGEKGLQSQLLDTNGLRIVRQRPTKRRVIEWYKATCLEILERAIIHCQWIPVFPVYADEFDVDGRIIRQGLIRNAKDPARMYNYWLTAATEEVALRTKTPYIGAEGQFEGYEDDWAEANVRSFPYLEYKPVTVEGSPAPPPERQPMTDIPSGFLQMALIASDNIKATTGLFDSSLGAIGNATSGVQERSQQRQGDLANYHLADNLMRAVRHAGRCALSMVPFYYDATRTVRILGEDGKLGSVEINKPNPAAQQVLQKAQAGHPLSEQEQAVQLVVHDLTVGTYDLTVSTGPSYQTLRQEAVDAQVGIAKGWPKLMEVAGDIVIGNMDWPGAEEIAERIKRTMPPAVLGPEEGAQEGPVVNTPRGPIPVEQAAQMLEQMNQQMQEMAAELEKAKQGIPKAQIDAQAKVDVAKIQAESAGDVAELTGLIKLLVAKMQPPPLLARDVAGDLEADDKGETEASAPAASQSMAPPPGMPSPAPGDAPSPGAPGGGGLPHGLHLEPPGPPGPPGTGDIPPPEQE